MEQKVKNHEFKSSKMLRKVAGILFNIENQISETSVQEFPSWSLTLLYSTCFPFVPSVKISAPKSKPGSKKKEEPKHEQARFLSSEVCV